jgi:hypothetical protein
MYCILRYIKSWFAPTYIFLLEKSGEASSEGEMGGNFRPLQPINNRYNHVYLRQIRMVKVFLSKGQCQEILNNQAILFEPWLTGADSNIFNFLKHI